MTSLFEWIESTWLSTTLRDSANVFVYPTILAFHTLGLAFLVGISSAISLRILGAAPSLPLAPLKKFFPVMWLGFWVNAVSGVLLLLIEPSRFLTMTDFYVKLLVIAGAVITMRLLYLNVFRNPVNLDTKPMPKGNKILAGMALTLWGAAITAGRLTAYDDATAQRQTALATLVISLVLLLVGYLVARLLGWTGSAPQGQVDMTTSRRGAMSR